MGFSTVTAGIPDDILKMAGVPPAPVTLKTILDNSQDSTGGGQQMGMFVREQLPIRLAQSYMQTNDLPHGLSETEPMQTLKQMYAASFEDVRGLPLPDPSTEAQWDQALTGIYKRHADTLVMVARGLHEIKRREIASTGELAELSEVHAALDRFFMSRIGTRMLIGQYLALKHDSYSSSQCGLISEHTSAGQVAADALHDARHICERDFGECPEVIIMNPNDLTFAYVPSHLYYVFFELFKNSMRAVMETHGHLIDIPPIKVVIADGNTNQDVVVKVSDEGGGIPRSHCERIFSYLFTTAKSAFEENEYDGLMNDHGQNSPLAGLGYGLPISRGYVRFFGGDLNIISMEGYGTDAFLHMRKLHPDGTGNG